jgi:ArsR family transcriptional regulator
VRVGDQRSRPSPQRSPPTATHRDAGGPADSADGIPNSFVESSIDASRSATFNANWTRDISTPPHRGHPIDDRRCPVCAEIDRCQCTLDCGYAAGMARRATLDPVACCSPVRSHLIDEQQADVLARSFAALADPVRLRLLSYIASAGNEVCACDLLEPSARSQPTVSHHMKILFEAGLITRDKRGPWVWYRAVPERLDALRAALA